MSRHFLLSAAARTLSLSGIFRMTDDDARDTFKRIRWAANGGEPFCPHCGCLTVYTQTASGHLARMATAGLLSVEKQGRHRYHRLASSAVAQMIESIMQVASGQGSTRPPLVVGPKDAALRMARTCYDHLAGRLGVALADALVGGGHLEVASDGGLVTDAGVEFFGRTFERAR